MYFHAVNVPSCPGHWPLEILPARQKTGDTAQKSIFPFLKVCSEYGKDNTYPSNESFLHGLFLPLVYLRCASLRTVYIKISDL